MPNIFIQIKNFFKSLFIHVKTGMKKVSGKEYMKRLETCTMCEFRRADRCGKCGCMIITKAKWKTSTCPINKW